ncbi:MAG: helicase HerA-like domain-containing protein, partial [Paracoccaceae bacterium]
PDKPKFVFFFDEAHLLFDDAPKALIDKVEQVARLIRSKGVGVYFISQNPADIPDDILGQLGNSVQHALRAYMPKDRKALKAAAETFRPNPDFKTDKAILEVGVGEALVSTLEKKGVPSIVQRTLIRPPSSRLGPCDAMVRAQAMTNSPVAGLYDTTADRESAYELLAARAARKAEADADVDQDELGSARTFGGKYSKGKRYNPAKPSKKVRKSRSSRSDSMFEAVAKSTLRSAGSQIGRTVVRSLLKGLFR